MKLIHLSDLHIGKRVNEVSMIEEQKYILLQILNIIDSEKPNAVMICGDIYDRSTPSADAVMLLDDFLYRLGKRRIPVMIISGNHDSPERIAFGNRMFEQGGIHISPVYDGSVKKVVLKDEYGEVVFYLLPFIRPFNVRHFYPDENIENYTDAVRVAIEKMEIDTSVRNVLLAHQFVTGASTCDSEEISVGGIDNVDASVFDEFDYVALGHIHGPQNIQSGRIRYCGTPLKYSFSEANHYKSVTVAELGEKGELKLHTVPLNPKHDMRVIRGNFKEVTDRAFYEGTVTDDYLHIILTDEDDIPEAMGKLRIIYPNLRHLSYDNTRTRTNQVIDVAADVQKKTHLELFEELYEMQNNQPMSEEQRTFAQKLIESIWEGNI